MQQDILNSLNTIADNIKQINTTVHSLSYSHWWNTQLFTSLLTAIVVVFLTLLVGELRDYTKERKKILKKFYLYFVKNRDLDSLLMQAQHTSYGHTSTTGGGETTVIPEKKMSEKVLIEFKQRYKYWNLPHSELRSLLKKCEKQIKTLQDKPLNDLRKTDEYKNMQNVVDKIIKLSEKKTGEDEWSIRSMDL